MKILETKKIIKELETFRLEKKISQEKLAKILGVAFCTVNRWFNYKNYPNKIYTYHIQKFLKKEVKKKYGKEKRN